MYYKPLTKENVKAIIELLTESLGKRLKEKNLGLTITERAKDYVIDNSFDPIYGARPLKRFLQSKVETLIARAILSGKYNDGDTVTVDAENGELILK